MNKFLKKAEGFVTSRGFSAGVVTAVVIALVIVANIIIYTLTSLFSLSLSSPIKRDYGITGVTDGIFAAAEEKSDKEQVTITFCMAESDLEVHTTGKYVLATARAYANRYSFVKLRFVNLLTQMDENGVFVDDLEKYKTSTPSCDMHADANNDAACDECGEPTELRTHSVIFEHTGGNFRVLTDAYSTAGFANFFTLDSQGSLYAYSGEEIIGAMISWVLQRNDQRKTVYFTENHGETVDVTFGNLLTAAGYYIDTVNLRTVNPEEDLKDAAFIVISNPTTDFGRAAEGSGIHSELERLETYLKKGNDGKGGKLYVSIDAYSDKLENLEAFLEGYGISLAGGEGKYGYSRELVVDPAESRATDGTSFNARFADGATSNKVVAKFAAYNTGKVLMSQVSRLKLDPSRGAEAMLLSSSTSRTVRDGAVTDTAGEYAVAAYSSRSEGGEATSEVFVVPSVLMTNSDILLSSGYSNRNYIYALLDEIYDADTAIYGARSIVYNSGAVENLTQRTATVYTVILIAIPVALAAVGAVVVIRRKRR